MNILLILPFFLISIFWYEVFYYVSKIFPYFVFNQTKNGVNNSGTEIVARYSIMSGSIISIFIIVVLSVNNIIVKPEAVLILLFALCSLFSFIYKKIL